MPRVRVHQHVNPLAPYYRQPPQPIEVEHVFANADLPVHLDIGCARGRFIFRMAEAERAWNFLGVEIREPLVIEANEIAMEAGLGNLHYAFCNAMLSLDKLIERIPDGLLQAATIQFPDPWFKKKHAKRRMVNKQLVEMIAARIAPGGRVFIQTDIESLADEMFRMFRGNERFEEIAIDANPFPIKTEREKAVEDKGLPVKRALFGRNRER